ncbi:serine/arginine-rich splicing factor 3-like [Paramacrobiotus metropolitanus]|uniref:serine/arginine-rich splicing factor 3-like n=1 Tax=Paramacrobiotus metropolitanus TaxID=2943436 RepID=UPI00244560DC|nr:serine/arginine-rich splicing factor 3-like [Paramacrobiotus metropolitanus]XP_055338651.1 serine/arginine-rich splicing factor 3-like [Paramacrobiotus metropolitanus]
MAKRTTQVFIGNLGNDGDKEEIKDLFGIFGPVRNVWLSRNPPGFGFVEYAYAHDASEACLYLDGKMICGRRVRVELSRYDLSRQSDATKDRNSPSESERSKDRSSKKSHEQRDHNRQSVSEFSREESTPLTAEKSSPTPVSERSSTPVCVSQRSPTPVHASERSSTLSPSRMLTVLDECAYSDVDSDQSSPGHVVDQYIAETEDCGVRKRSLSESCSQSSTSLADQHVKRLCSDERDEKVSE